MKLITQKYNNHVSLDTVEEFERIILSDKSIISINETNKTLSKVLFYIYRIIPKKKSFKNNNSQVKDLLDKPSQSHFFVILMGLDFSKCLPFFISSNTKSIYLFDAWPKKHDEIIKFLNIFKVKNLFLSSSQAVEIIQSKTKYTNCFWVAEGINVEGYKHYSFKDKTIDVIALGRKYDSYHQQIVTSLENNKKVYLYEKEKGKIIFPTRNEFIEGMAKSKISICVPSNITHSERSGDIETMTIRYLQSMVSKCLILGHAPKEMITLFGYNPVIEIDSKDPEGQILSILNNYEYYHQLIEKNYQVVLKNHTWSNRWDKIKQLLNEN